MHSFRNVFPHLAYVEEPHVTEFSEGRPTPWMPEVMRIPTDRFRSSSAVRKPLEEAWALGFPERGPARVRPICIGGPPGIRRLERRSRNGIRSVRLD